MRLPHRHSLAVFGIFPDRVHVEDAIEALRGAGFRNTDISILFSENVGSKDFAHEKHTKAPEGAVTGAASGAFLGGTLGWLVGIGLLTIPGAGAFVAAGPIVSVFAGIGVGGAIGGFAGALVGLGMPEYEAKRYEGRLRRGGILLSVHSDDQGWASRAREILEMTGAEDIAAEKEAHGDYAETKKPMERGREGMEIKKGRKRG